MELIDLNMLSKKVRDGDIRVEISIGNEGNIDIAENEIEVGTSITAPAAPRFDGSSQWFISWDNRKPCLQLESSWEDVCYRIFTLNQLRSTANILTDAAELLRLTRLRRDVPDDEMEGIAGDVKLALTTFSKVGTMGPHQSGEGSVDLIPFFSNCGGGKKNTRLPSLPFQACTEPLPELPVTVFTRLDHHLMQLREKTLKEAYALAQSLLESVNAKGDLKILDALQDDDILDLQVGCAVWGRDVGALCANVNYALSVAWWERKRRDAHALTRKLRRPFPR